MEMKNASSITTTNTNDHMEGDDDAPLPGFRFHPTDEELVGFYLTRKVERRPISIELIKQADIYKYDPWDLPKSSNVGDKEWYFFCKRGRKYRNSIRPNRVTGSGFWKATGIDRPIYSSDRARQCIGLKKSLVYYRGSAGKGTKTDWMMHEFRLPADNDKSTKHVDVTKSSAAHQEAEVWTLCRIFKRDISYNKKIVPDWREVAAKRNTINPPLMAADSSSKTCSVDSSDHQNRPQISYISFNDQPLISQLIHDEKKPYSGNYKSIIANEQQQQQQFVGHYWPSVAVTDQAPSNANSSFSSSMTCAENINELLIRHAENWEDFRFIIGCAASDPFYFEQ